MQWTYEYANDLLEARRRPQRPPSTPENDREQLALSRSILHGRPNSEGMRGWLHQLGNDDASINRMHILHVAGIKGKGRTCLFSEALLAAHRRRTSHPATYGLYTSAGRSGEARERMRINPDLVTREQFVTSVKQVWAALDLPLRPASKDSNENLMDGSSRGTPRFMQLCFLICIDTFFRAGVDVAIIEAHLGGEFDATNVFHRPAVTAITSLEMKHSDQLGPTLGDVAWHMAGIFRPGCPALTASTQPSDVKDVLSRRATEEQTELEPVPESTLLVSDDTVLTTRGQRTDLSLAVAVIDACLRCFCAGVPASIMADDVRHALEKIHTLSGSNLRI